jgi:hypothetical protein
MASAFGQSIYGWPHELADDAFGASWGGTEAGSDALALARTDLGLPLDEITLANPRTAEQVVYKVTSGTKGPRATSTGHLRETAHASVLVLSTGEKSLAQFIGKSLQEGARKRLVDVPEEVQPGSGFETIPRDQIDIESKRLFAAMKRQHGAVGRTPTTVPYGYRLPFELPCLATGGVAILSPYGRDDLTAVVTTILDPAMTS